jgi:hypothetical protein
MEKNIINDNFFNNIISSSQFRLNIIKTTVNNIDFTPATHVYGVYNCEIFTRSNSTLQLSYIDGTNTVQYSAITA